MVHTSSQFHCNRGLLDGWICLHLPAVSQRKTHIRQRSLACACTTFRPQALDISDIIAGMPPTQQQAQQVQQNCLETGFLAVTGHGISDEQLQQLFAAARRFFDLPLTAKMEHVVGDMQQGRGYEISPEHKQYMLDYAQVCLT